jgi:hypothetical protein
MKSGLLLLIGWAIAVQTLTSFSQGTFQNGSLDVPGVPDGGLLALLSGNTFINGWVTTAGFQGTFSGTVEYLSDRSQNPGGSCVELGYYFGTNGLQQTFTTAPNQDYLVSFWLATDPYNGPAGILRVSAGGRSADFQAPGGTGDGQAMGWQQHQFAFTSDNTGLSTLWFGNLYGITAIDTISVTSVPEPGVGSLLGLVIASAVWEWRRRRNTPDVRD